ncbi:hypothetical protein MTO96_037168 [Rhipicephalus appendiculatus]
MCGVQGCARTYREYESYRRHMYRAHRKVMDLDKSENSDDDENSGSASLHPQSSAYQSATEHSVFIDDDPCSSGSAMDGSGDTYRDASGGHRSDVVDAAMDFSKKVRKQLCLLFFRVAEVHRLPRSITQFLFSDFKTTFVEFIGLLAKLIDNTSPATIKEELHRLLAPDFFSDIFGTVETKHQREKFARQNLAYVKPEEHKLQVGDTYQYIPIPRVLQTLASSDNFWTYVNNDV